MVIGFACGLAAGAIIALVLPRDDGPRRRTLTFDPGLDPDSDPGPEPTADGRVAAGDPVTRDPATGGPDLTAGSGERPEA